MTPPRPAPARARRAVEALPGADDVRGIGRTAVGERSRTMLLRQPTRHANGRTPDVVRGRAATRPNTDRVSQVDSCLIAIV